MHHVYINTRFHVATRNIHKGFGFVEFELPEDAEAAIDNMHLAELNGKVIKVQLAKPSNITATSHRAGKYFNRKETKPITLKKKPPFLLYIVWTEESWLQKYANAEDNGEETQQTTESKTEDSDEENATPQRNTKPSPSKGERSRVYLDIQIGGSLAGRIEIEV